MDAVVRIQGLVKKFRKRQRLILSPLRWFSKKKGNGIEKKGEVIAVNDVSFDIQRGEIFGLLGPNGAGKTTLIKCLATLILPDAGEVEILGYDLLRQAGLIRQSIGLTTSGERSLYWKLTAWENLIYFSALYGMSSTVAKPRMEALLKQMDLWEDRDVRVEKFSSGMKQKLSIARALLHDPAVLFLDEPTVGLDPTFSRTIRQTIQQDLQKKQNKTILLTTHYMEEANALCDRIAIIYKGKIVALDTPERLKRSIPFEEVIKIRYEGILDKFLVQRLQEKIHFTLEEKKEDRLLYLRSRGLSDHLGYLVKELSQDGLTVQDLSIWKPTLEDVFLHYTGASLSEESRSPDIEESRSL